MAVAGSHGCSRVNWTKVHTQVNSLMDVNHNG